ncbi:MAG: hypothetical protein GC159_22135 [Phycisphaera sp.]|nr:hypothetical protein [Phycisphaera sp.]
MEATAEVVRHHHSPPVIEVRLRDLRQLFNTLDATPFPERDLDADAEEFIVGWALDLPADAPLTLRIQVVEMPDDPARLVDTEQAIRHYFDYRTAVINRQFRQMLSRGRLSLIIGLTCLTLSVTAAELMAQFGPGTLHDIIRESLIIGGWVAMWRPLEIFLYDWWPLRHQRRVCERLAQATIEIGASK